jgi:hypothetical protein
MFRTLSMTLSVYCIMTCGGFASGQTVFPSADGTLADGGIYGPFDGVADDWDWTFNESGYEGSITLTTAAPPGLEHRVVWEYSLSGVTLEPPVSAELTFTVRGAPIWPFPDVDVCVFSYPADMLESPEDFAVGPAIFQGLVTVVAYQPPTVYALDVSEVVSEALLMGGDAVAFRFQVDPDTGNESNQAFIDALDSDPATKPFLSIGPYEPIVGDIDGDGDVDLSDLAALLGSYGACAGDPAYDAAADLDGSGCIDLADLAQLLANYGTGT